MVKNYTQVVIGLILLPALLVLSCAHTSHYVEPALPESETAVLKAKIPAWIISIDGLSVPYNLSSDGKAAKVTVGPHTVKISFKELETVTKTEPGKFVPYVESRRVTSLEYVPMNFIAKPGHTYVITATANDKLKKWSPAMADFAPLNSSGSHN